MYKCVCVCLRLNYCSIPPGWVSFFLLAGFQFCFSSVMFLFFRDETTHRMNACQKSVTLSLSLSSPPFSFFSLSLGIRSLQAFLCDPWWIMVIPAAPANSGSGEHFQVTRKRPWDRGRANLYTVNIKISVVLINN